MSQHSIALIAAACLTLACGDITEAPEAGDRKDPVITEISPTSGGVGGGTVATITGEGFTDDTIVLIGDRQSDTVEVMSDTEIVFVVPPGEAPAVAVDVAVANDSGATLLSNGFIYNPAPSIYRVAPRGGPSAGGTEVTISGRGFTDFEAGENRVSFNGASATIVEVVSDSEMRVSTPLANVDEFVPIDIELANSNGTSTLAEGYFYTKPGLLAASSRNLNGVGGALFFIDPTDPKPFKLTDLPFGITSMSLDADGNLVVSTRRRGPGPFLGFLDPIEATLDIIAPFDTNNGTWLAHIGTTLYGYPGGGGGAAANSELRTVSVSDATTTPINAANDLKTAPGLGQASRLARRDDDTLYLCNQMSNGASFYTVAVATGVATELTTLNNVPLTGVCHGMTVIGSQVLAVIWNNIDTSVLVSINPSTGQVTEIFEAPFRMTGLAPTPPGF